MRKSLSIRLLLAVVSTAGFASEIRAAHSRYFAGREADILALWDSPRQREAYDWFTAELANLRTAFRWAADQGDLDVAATIATYAAFVGFLVEIYEPIAWAEELIEAARAVDHPRLAFLYVMASQCCLAGRPEAAVRYSDAAQTNAERRSRPFRARSSGQGPARVGEPVATRSRGAQRRQRADAVAGRAR